MVGKIIPLENDPENPIPTVLDGRMRADAMVEEQRRLYKDRPDISDEMVAAFEMPHHRPQGIEVKIDPVDRVILVEFNGQNVAVLRWFASIGQFRVRRRVQVDGITTKDPVEYPTDVLGMWNICREYGITPGEFVQAFRDMPPQIQWTFDQCPYKLMDCKLFPTASPHTNQIFDLKCKSCDAVFGMDEHAKTTLKEPGQNPRGRTVAASVPSAPAPQRPPADFEKEFSRWRGSSGEKWLALSSAGVNSWEEAASKDVEFYRALGWRKTYAEEFIEMAKERV